jgi:predicted AlkP superfamily phosphohydrolase/phosphomutase
VSDDAGPVFVLGLDGVPWDMLSEWIEAGELPNFGRLVDEGAAGPCLSTTPALTALAWPSIATGVRPDKHGIYAFNRMRSDYTRDLAGSTTLKRPALWDIVPESTAVNVPMTYPAGDIDGRMITGMMTPDSRERFTTPPELKDELERAVPEYTTGLKWKDYYGRPEQLLADLVAATDTRERAMEWLLEDPWELFFIVFTEPDRLQHLVWDADTLRSYYRRMDELLGNVLDVVEDNDGTLFVVSDHGFGPVHTKVYANAVLADAGLLVRKGDSGVRGLFQRTGLTRGRIRSALNRVGISDQTITDVLPGNVAESVAGQLPGSHGVYDVDFPRTAAFVRGMGNVYVHDTERFDDGTVTPAEHESVKATVREAFESLADPETGDRVFTVADGAELFPTDDGAPDLVLQPEPGYSINATDLPDDPFGDPGALVADHRPEGVLFAWGDAVASGTALDATVYDVAPTVLHALGRPIPDDADGRVLSELFAPGSPPATRAVESTAYHRDRTTDDDEDADLDRDDVEERLRGLGYIE